MQVTQSERPRPLADWMMAGGALLVIATTIAAVWFASGLPLVHDAPLMHYIVFLMEKGFAPYRDIVDMNLPGSYLLERAAMHVFGGGAVAWICWDAFTGLIAIATCVWITGSRRIAAGLISGGLLYLYHLRDAAWDLGQRDWLVTVLLLLAFGCLFTCIRKAQPVWMSGFVCFCGLAMTIKPLALLILVLFFPTALWLQRRFTHRIVPTIGWAVAGGVPPLLVMVIFLSSWHVWAEFYTILRTLIPFYASLQPAPYSYLVRFIFPSAMKYLLLGTVYLFFRQRVWRSWDSAFLATGALCGLLFFVIQRKGWSYHSYTAAAFALLLTAMELDFEFRRERGNRYLAIVMLLMATVLLPYKFLKTQIATVYPMETITHLESDLNDLGGKQLSGQVQCLDMTMGGCINVLYRLQLVQATGSIYDFYLFPQEDTAVTRTLQQRFLAQMNTALPKVIVLSAHIWPGDTYGYDEVSRWPAFENFLASNYRIGSEYRQPNGAGYRILLRK